MRPSRHVKSRAVTNNDVLRGVVIPKSAFTDGHIAAASSVNKKGTFAYCHVRVAYSVT